MINQVHAQIVNPNGPNTLTTQAGIQGLEAVFQNVIGIIIPFGAIVLFVILMYGGIRYITAGANPRSVEAARNTITYGIIGMVVLAMAFLILVIIELLTGADITTFQLYF